MFMTVKQASEKWGISDRRIRVLCSEGNNSNAIEGNTLTLRETDLVLRGLTIDQKPLKDHMEAVGHKEAFDYIRELVRDNVPLSERVIKQIHYLVLADKKDDRGVYTAVFPCVSWERNTSRCSHI